MKLETRIHSTMASKSFLLLGLLVVAASLLAQTGPVVASYEEVPKYFNRTNFGSGFMFGSSQSAYQVCTHIHIYAVLEFKFIFKMMVRDSDNLF